MSYKEVTIGTISCDSCGVVHETQVKPSRYGGPLVPSTWIKMEKPALDFCCNKCAAAYFIERAKEDANIGVTKKVTPSGGSITKEILAKIGEVRKSSDKEAADV